MGVKKSKGQKPIECYKNQVRLLSLACFCIYYTCRTKRETNPSKQKTGYYREIGLAWARIGKHARCRQMYDTMAYEGMRTCP
jgi:hypothetical protein